MPRKARMYLPGVPCHVISRGNNRDACFYSDDDSLFYLTCLQGACQRYGVSLHAYVLMSNHVHLLMTPAREDGISKVMQSVGRRYVQYINMNYRRSGTLWEGRHKSSLVDAEDYVLACYRYIELNPVRAGMVEHPADYRWSSYRVMRGLTLGGLWCRMRFTSVYPSMKIRNTKPIEHFFERNWEAIYSRIFGRPHSSLCRLEAAGFSSRWRWP